MLQGGKENVRRIDDHHTIGLFCVDISVDGLVSRTGRS